MRRSSSKFERFNLKFKDFQEIVKFEKLETVRDAQSPIIILIGHTHRQTDKQTNSHKDKQTDRHGQTYRQTQG